MKSGAATWRGLVTIQGRYHRSVHIERDAAGEGWTNGYVVTPLARRLAKRIHEGLTQEPGQRAWSITGPYGSGKSAFVLYLSRQLGIGSQRTARGQDDDEVRSGTLFGRMGTAKDRGGLVPVLVTGERQPIETLLLGALHKAALGFWSGRGVRPDALSRVDELHSRALSGKLPSTRDVVHVFEEIAKKVAHSAQGGDGLLVVLDEAGKSLEFAAQAQGRGDIHILQELAEAASRSKAPIVFVVVLHQAFEHYAGRLNQSQRNEWAKVQGRFEDLPFQEATDQVLRLIGTALQKPKMPPDLARQVAEIAHNTASFVARGEGESIPKYESLLRETAPLHPVTALTIGPLFRSRLAQNERSIFSFLSSAEPGGFQDFLDRPMTKASPSFYTLDLLYDYIANNLGGRLYGQQGQQWAQIETSLRRLAPDAHAIDARLLKAIGLIAMTADQTGTGASEDLLAVAVGDARDGAALRQALERLRSSSLIVYRKYKGAYQLWEGSDLDLDRLTTRFASEIGGAQSLVGYLQRVAPPRPLLALRHFFETGTLRHFEVRYVDDPAEAQGIVDASQADGTVLVLVPGTTTISSAEVQELSKSVRSAVGRPTLFATVGATSRIRELAFELGALEKVQTHTPQLQDDPAARRELLGRIAEAERHLRAELQQILAGGGDCHWFMNGHSLVVDSPKSLASSLSDACGRAYPSAPEVHSELVNRRTLSSSAAKARRILLEAMVERPGEERLGISGAPPELAMYRSVLEAHGLHGRQGGRWAFQTPGERTRPSTVWEEIGRSLETGGERRVSLPEIYSALAKPPFGMRDGISPLFVVAYMLTEGDELAFYEDETFLPALTTPVLERLIRSPERFQIQRFRIAGERAPLFQRLLASLTGGKADHRFSVVPLIKYLVRFMRELPDYSRNTKSVSERAQAVREAVLRAQEPGPLVFGALPRACGFPAFSAVEAADETKADGFVAVLRAALRELQVAYPTLLNTIEQTLASGFNLSAGGIRKELSARSKQISLLATESQLKGFLIRASDDALDRESWLVSIGTLLVGKPPESWHDRDAEQLRVSLGFMARKFRALESLVLAGLPSPSSAGPQLIRISVAQSGEGEQERVVAIRDEDQTQVAELCARLKDLLGSRAASLPPDSILGALAMTVGSLLARESIEDHQQKVSK